MEELIELFQGALVSDFGYDDDRVIEALTESIESLRRAHLDLPPAPDDPTVEVPNRPFGQFDQPSVEQLISCMSQVSIINYSRKYVRLIIQLNC